MELRAANFCLRPAADRDAAAIAAVDRDPQVRAHLLDSPIDTPFKALAVITLSQQLQQNNEALGFWSAFDSDNNYLGYFSLMPSEHDDIELGVKLAPSAWGKHVALGGGRLLCQHAAANSLPNLVGIFAPGNRVIPLLLKRLGFEADGTVQHFGKPAVRYRRLFS